MNGWWYALIFAVAYAWPRLIAHELSHACTQVVLGGEVRWKKFRPWPTKYKGRRYWGLMFRDDMPGKIDDLLVSLAPLERAQLFMLAWVPFAALYWPLWVFVAWELTDVIHWWAGWAYKPHSDGGKVRAILIDLRDGQ